MNTDTPFETLCRIACEVYDVPPESITNRRARTHDVTTCRNLIAAIWSQAHGCSDTARRVGYAHPSSVSRARDRAHTLVEIPSHAWRIDMIMKRVAEELPWLAITNNTTEQT